MAKYSTAAAMTAIAGGEVSAISTVAADIRALVQGGKARLLAVAGEQRDATFPDVPTFRELGYDLVAKPWYGLFAPAGTPPAAVDRLAKAAMAAVNDPALSKRLVEMGLEPTGTGPDRLGAWDVRPGDIVSIWPWILHRHRKLWDDPDAFDIERFGGKGGRHRFQYLPFGAGPRTCVGAQFATTARQVTRRPRCGTGRLCDPCWLRP